jgi:hypothetical protein
VDDPGNLLESALKRERSSDAVENACVSHVRCVEAAR